VKKTNVWCSVVATVGSDDRHPDQIRSDQIDLAGRRDSEARADTGGSDISDLVGKAAKPNSVQDLDGWGAVKLATCGVFLKRTWKWKWELEK